MSAAKLVICSHHAGGVPRAAALARWRDEVGPATLETRDALGFERYAQLHCVSPAHALRGAIAVSRSRLVASLVALVGPGWSHAPRSPSAPRGPAERWTVLDELWWPSREALLSAASTGDGRAALLRLREVRAPQARRTAAVVCTDLVIRATRPERADTARVAFCLRARPGHAPERMQAYWRNGHAELVARLAGRLGFDQYDQSHAILDDPRAARIVEALGGTQERPYMGFANLSFPTVGSLARQFVKPTTQVANFQLMRDELEFIDPPACPVVLGARLPLG